MWEVIFTIVALIISSGGIAISWITLSRVISNQKIQDNNFIRLTSNDLVHLSADVKEIKDKVNGVVCKVECLEKEVSKIQGKLGM